MEFLDLYDKNGNKLNKRILRGDKELTKNVSIHLIKENQYQSVANVIERSLRFSHFNQFYPQTKIEALARKMNPDFIKKRASWTHFYVIEIDEKVIACGAVGLYWDSQTESALFTVFVDPDYQGCGYGRKIIETLEKDEYFKRATRIEVAASISAIPFYRKMGYEHKNNKLVYSEGHFKMEKFTK